MCVNDSEVFIKPREGATLLISLHHRHSCQPTEQREGSSSRRSGNQPSEQRGPPLLQLHTGAATELKIPTIHPTSGQCSEENPTRQRFWTNGCCRVSVRTMTSVPRALSPGLQDVTWAFPGRTLRVYSGRPGLAGESACYPPLSVCLLLFCQS